MSKKSELEKLQRVLMEIPETKKEMCESLMDQCAFMADQLKKLQRHIQKNGWTETYQNGANQSGKKKSSEAETYIAMQKNYVTAIKQLLDLAPGEVKGDEFTQFLSMSPVKAKSGPRAKAETS